MIDRALVTAAIQAQGDRQTRGIEDIESYLAQQVGDASHRDVTGPLLAGGGASGVVLHQGEPVGDWGDPDRPEMLFSATKSFLSLVAGVAFGDGLLDPGQPVSEVIELPALAEGESRKITWEHLLQQRSGWEGVLWDKPSSVDAQSQRDGPTAARSHPGTQWAYNDVRVNLLALALTARFDQSLERVLAERVMTPIGASSTWSWHGYANSYLDSIPVVSGGAHWGGGLFISARDLALVGELCRREGDWYGTRIIEEAWFARQWAPCPIKPDYGYLWWLNHEQTVFEGAPRTGVCARGNGGRHLLWVDPARDLVIASHWGDEVHRLLEDVSDAIAV
jgi:CubicO group peptidase (beta-lactamase class C family)